MRGTVSLLYLAVMCCVIGLGGTEARGAGKGAAEGGRGERTVLGDLDLRTPSGKQVSLIPLVGSKAIVVVFFTSGCASCAEEVSRLNAIDSDKMIKVVAVNEGERPGKIEEWARKHNASYDIVVDQNGAVARAFEVPEVPSCVILSRSGLIVYRGRVVPEEIEYYVMQ